MSDASSLMHLIFKVRDTLYGFELPYVQEVVQLPELTSMANMPHGIAGFLNLRGEIIYIVDMPVTLGYPPKQYTLNDYIIVLKKESEFYFGVLVSEILDIKQVHEEETPSGKEEKRHVFPLVSKIVRFNNEIVFILDPNLIYRKVAVVNEQMPISDMIKNASPAYFTVTPEDRMIFMERVKTLSKKMATETAKDVTALTVIQLNQELFGIDPEIVKEFTVIEEYTLLPRGATPPYLLGFINIRGEILTMVDIWQILKSEPLEIKENSKVLVITVEDLIIGILIDEVVDVIYVKPEDFRNVPLGMQKTHEEFIKQTVIYEKEVLGVLNLAKVIETIWHTAEAVEK